MQLYKTLGTIEDGAFNFYKKEDAIPDSKRNVFMDDDTF